MANRKALHDRYENTVRVSPSVLSSYHSTIGEGGKYERFCMMNITLSYAIVQQSMAASLEEGSFLSLQLEQK